MDSKTIGDKVVKASLPTIKELYDDKSLEIVRKSNALNVLLNQKPKKEWLLKHPFAKKEAIDQNGKKINVPIEYISIQRVEWLLTTVFTNWSVEVMDYKLIANSVAVHIRLHVKDPVTNEWRSQDGVGAAPLQTKKGTSATDWNSIQTNAVMIGLPAAKTFAIKDAAEQLGKLFGKDINRFDDILYDNLRGQFDNTKLDEIKAKLPTIKTIDELSDYYFTLEDYLTKDDTVNTLFNERKREIGDEATKA